MRRPPAKPTPRWLRNSALHYLRRFAPTTTRFRQVMTRRLRRGCEHHGVELREGLRWLDELVDELTLAGALDDARWVRARAESLRRGGASTPMLRAKLRAAGAPPELIDAVVADLCTEQDSDLEAARAYARRRRLGPWEPDPRRRADRREKHLASLARQGFRFAVAQAVVDGERDS